MKLAQIQSEIKVPKGQFNNFGKYKYRSCEDIVEAVKPILNSHGFCLTITDEIVLIGERYYVKATASIWDGTENYSATAFAREEEIKKGMDSAQVTGAASSYARKYALNGLFAIDDTKDADTNKGEDDALQSWKDELAKCKTDSDLMYLWNGNKETVTNSPEIKELFTKRKSQLK